MFAERRSANSGKPNVKWCIKLITASLTPWLFLIDQINGISGNTRLCGQSRCTFLHYLATEDKRRVYQSESQAAVPLFLQLSKTQTIKTMQTMVNIKICLQTLSSSALFNIKSQKFCILVSIWLLVSMDGNISRFCLKCRRRSFQCQLWSFHGKYG